MIVNYTGFNVTWNVTRVGVTVEVPCTGPGLNGNYTAITAVYCISYEL